MAKRGRGEGSVYKKTQTVKGKVYVSWEAQVTVGFDENGKRVRKSFSGKTKAEVQKKMQEAAVAVMHNDYFEPSKMTVSHWFNIWLSEYLGSVKYQTRVQYDCMYRNHIKPELGCVKLSALSGPMIQKFYNRLQTTTRYQGRSRKEEKPLSAKTIKNIHGILSKALKTAVEQGLLKRNPAEYAKIPRVEKTEIKPLSDDEVADFMSLCGDTVYGRYLMFVLYTGLREAEAIGLTWDCVDFRRAEIKINKQLQRRVRKDGGYTVASLKNDKVRSITVSPYVLNILKTQKKIQLEERLKAGEYWQGFQNLAEQKTAFVFTKPDGDHLRVSTVYDNFKKIARQIGTSDSRVHDLRHTFAVISLQNGDDVKTVQTNLGHATAAFTLDVYGHASERMRRESADRMQQYIESLS